MVKAATNITLIEGEIVKVSPIEENENNNESFYVYILNSVKKAGKIVSYAVLPIHIIPDDSSGQKIELDLLRTHKRKISEKIESPAHQNRYYRATLELNELPAQGQWRFTPVDRITNIAVQKQIEQNLVKSFVQSNFSIVDGKPLFVSGIAESRTIPKESNTPYYIDIDVSHAAIAGFIPQEVADILKNHGKISRLGTAASVAKDENTDKLRQIYDKARPNQTMSFDDFSNYIKTGMSYFNTQAPLDSKDIQDRLPEGAFLKYPDKEKIKFKFVERRPDISLEDAFHAHGFIAEEDTYKTLKAAGLKTLRHAFESLEEHGVSILRTAFHKANKSSNSDHCSLHDILEDLWEAHKTFVTVLENPNDYEPFPWSTQTAYPIQEVK